MNNETITIKKSDYDIMVQLLGQIEPLVIENKRLKEMLETQEVDVDLGKLMELMEVEESVDPYKTWEDREV